MHVYGILTFLRAARSFIFSEDQFPSGSLLSIWWPILYSKGISAKDKPLPWTLSHGKQIEGCLLASTVFGFEGPAIKQEDRIYLFESRFSIP